MPRQAKFWNEKLRLFSYHQFKDVFWVFKISLKATNPESEIICKTLLITLLLSRKRSFYCRSAAKTGTEQLVHKKPR